MAAGGMALISLIAAPAALINLAVVIVGVILGVKLLGYRDSRKAESSTAD